MAYPESVHPYVPNSTDTQSYSYPGFTGSFIRVYFDTVNTAFDIDTVITIAGGGVTITAFGGFDFYSKLQSDYPGYFIFPGNSFSITIASGAGVDYGYTVTSVTQGTGLVINEYGDLTLNLGTSHTISLPQVFLASGGYTWSVTGGAFPSNVVLAGLTFTGFAIEFGTFAVTLKVTDSLGQTGTYTQNFIIIDPNADYFAARIEPLPADSYTYQEFPATAFSRDANRKYEFGRITTTGAFPLAAYISDDGGWSWRAKVAATVPSVRETINFPMQGYYLRGTDIAYIHKYVQEIQDFAIGYVPGKFDWEFVPLLRGGFFKYNGGPETWEDLGFSFPSDPTLEPSTYIIPFTEADKEYLLFTNTAKTKYTIVFNTGYFRLHTDAGGGGSASLDIRHPCYWHTSFGAGFAVTLGDYTLDPPVFTSNPFFDGGSPILTSTVYVETGGVDPDTDYAYIITRDITPSNFTYVGVVNTNTGALVTYKQILGWPTDLLTVNVGSNTRINCNFITIDGVKNLIVPYSTTEFATSHTTTSLWAIPVPDILTIDFPTGVSYSLPVNDNIQPAPAFLVKDAPTSTLYLYNLELIPSQPLVIFYNIFDPVTKTFGARHNLSIVNTTGFETSFSGFLGAAFSGTGAAPENTGNNFALTFVSNGNLRDSWLIPLGSHVVTPPSVGGWIVKEIET